MNKRIKKISLDLQRGYFIVESWKEGKEKNFMGKRNREKEDYDYDLPTSYNLKNVEPNDKAQVEGILKLVIGMTELEFDIDLESQPRNYKLNLKNIEMFEVTAIDKILQKFKVFIPNVEVNFPAKYLSIFIRKSDTPLEKIAPIQRRKKVKLK